MRWTPTLPMPAPPSPAPRASGVTQPLIARVGYAIYGNHWTVPMADDLKVNVRTVQRWGAGKFQTPPRIFVELAKIAQTLARDLDKLTEEMNIASEEKKP